MFVLPFFGTKVNCCGLACVHMAKLSQPPSLMTTHKLLDGIGPWPVLTELPQELLSRVLG